jgi:hypothetical protein
MRKKWKQQKKTKKTKQTAKFNKIISISKQTPDLPVSALLIH